MTDNPRDTQKARMVRSWPDPSATGAHVRPRCAFDQQYLGKLPPAVDPFVQTVPPATGDDLNFPGRKLGQVRWRCRLCDAEHNPRDPYCRSDRLRDAVLRLRVRIAELETQAARVPELEAQLVTLAAQRGER